MQIEFTGKTAIVTGAAHGFGRAISLAFAKRGASVWVCDILGDELAWGYPVWFLFFIGFVEFVGGLLLIVPRFNVYGAIAIFFVMAGAFVTRIIHGTDLGDALSISFYGVCMLMIVEDGGFLDRFKKSKERV